ncbi:MAG TPA: aspartate 1-decarboxylase [Candidatus Polarisedimenticolaceae bacterium]|nr:aspartate 1-decarboxylase [Candidatus Polarisedimenticolaceae bacterium]
MNRTMLRAKIHRVAVTECDVTYEGSLTLDAELIERAGMLPFERIEVYDVDNANRFSTYLIAGRRGSGECCVNGAAAKLVDVGDKLILASFTTLPDELAVEHRPTIVLVGEGNRVKSHKQTETAGVRVEH